MPSFDSLPLHDPLKKALQRLGFLTMTPIQQSTLPSILEGKNVIAQAATGSGKTLAFALGTLNGIQPKLFAPQALVLCPTRELSEQVAKVVRSCAAEIGNIKVLTLCGGVPMKGQIHSLGHGAHIIVGTPGRVLKLLEIEKLDLSRCKTAVLDEADRMVDMGFIEDIEAIFARLPQTRQTLLFSATYPESIRELSEHVCTDPLFLQSGREERAPSITEIAYIVQDKVQALSVLLQQHTISSAIIFCNTKLAVSELCETLNDIGVHAIALHGDMEQLDRNEAILQFRNGSAPFLVATDVAGRGIDIEGLETIINYDLPQQIERYVHRIGRTGRAGTSGKAITLLLPYQQETLQSLGRDIELEEFPSSPLSEPYKSPMRTICIDGGKKEKLRAGDIVGALIHECGLTKEEIGKIDQFEHLSYVALPRSLAEKVHKKLINRPIKGRIFRLWLLD